VLPVGGLAIKQFECAFSKRLLTATLTIGNAHGALSCEGYKHVETLFVGVLFTIVYDCERYKHVETLFLGVLFTNV